MTGGWTADGQTAPSWRGCNHDGTPRCRHCRAKAWPDFVQAHRPGSGLGAIPIGSPYLVPLTVHDYSLMKGGADAVSRKTWNGTCRRRR